MNKATTHSQISLIKWQKANHWIERATDYDNARADQIMAQDVNIVTRYQQKVTEAGLEDMQMLRAAWQKAFERIANTDGLTPNQELDAINSLTTSRMKIETLARTASKMPEKYKPEGVMDTPESNPKEFIQLTLAGPKTELIEDGKYSQPEAEKTPEQLSSEIVSATSEATGDQDLDSEI